MIWIRFSGAAFTADIFDRDISPCMILALGSCGKNIRNTTEICLSDPDFWVDTLLSMRCADLLLAS